MKPAKETPNCPHCGKVFVKNKQKQRFCSTPCNLAWSYVNDREKYWPQRMNSYQRESNQFFRWSQYPEGIL